jgi:PAS domain S-box-containing protein
MAQRKPPSLPRLDEDTALRTILEGTSTETGEPFFAALVKNLAKALNTHGAWVTEFIEDCQRLRALAFWLDGKWVDDYEYAVVGTPCEVVVAEDRLVHVPDNVVELYPNDPDLKAQGAVSYMGVPLTDIDGSVLGHLAVLHTQPMPDEPRGQAILQIFAARASAELQRLRAESELQRREEKLGRLVDSAMDAIIELDQELKVTRMNPAAEKTLACDGARVVGRDFTQFISAESRGKLTSLIQALDARPKGERYLWIPGGLNAKRADGHEFPAEATLSRFEMQHRTFHTLILRNVNERLEAERKIRSLTVETEYLREEIKALQNFDEIIGKSEPMLRVLRDIEQVAATDATVLLLGETGTGKEVIARAIHAASRRRGKPLIKVNCAAIPATLIESELFGHEKGAFTGATQKREGRFALADRGTIFLDEIGDLPLELQVKLLRVLQEGEFEPVGSSRTRKVDVRVLTATNRDLHQAVQEGNFREDLYYRLNVFPLHLPPLRDRGEDISLLASTFAERFAGKMGRTVEPLSPECIRRLERYPWPGNVRELQNVIERAVITCRDRRLNLDRALPETGQAEPAVATASPDEAARPIFSARELQQLECDNIIRALESAGWRVAGENGAAELLGMKPSTLSSRMKALGIKRPPQD